MVAKNKPPSVRKRAMRRRRMFHARERALQRFDYSLSEEEFATILGQIKKGGADLVADISSSAAIYRVMFSNGAEAHACYDRDCKIIRTFIPTNWPLMEGVFEE